MHALGRPMWVFVVSTLQLSCYVWLCKAKALHYSLNSAQSNVALSQVYLAKLASGTPDDDSIDPETPVGVGTTGANLDDKLSEEKKGRGGKVEKCTKEDWPALFGYLQVFFLCCGKAADSIAISPFPSIQNLLSLLAKSCSLYRKSVSAQGIATFLVLYFYF